LQISAWRARYSATFGRARSPCKRGRAWRVGVCCARGASASAVKPRKAGTTSPTLAVHARTLELYRQLDLAHVVVERGHKVPAVRLWVKGEPRTRIDFEQIGSDLTPYA